MIIPAIDLYQSKSVRLYQGDFDQLSIINDDPVQQAMDFANAGIQKLHLVDLDGAKAGRPINQKIIEAIVQTTSLKVEIGGGIRDEATADQWLSTGVDRIVLGSAAIQDPDLLSTLIQKYGPDRVVVGVDGKNNLVATDGWLKQSQLSFGDLIAAMFARGVREFIVTDTTKDGTLSGPNVALLQSLNMQFPNANIIASGGISNIDDIITLQKAGINDIIVGKALATNNITLTEITALSNPISGGK
ncbi:1-(5-phosphoribosyl)-5-[(5-phosphoribosylamino)methylideneamino]imidazole-4-carboxamide isomerase [Leuconostoc fallax]|uniref:1-(5-phosphoribosyl)-5-[(5- phosphoribosylamino)methylideneamino]imidazole-4- carboxamide isomerase n=1 Tax=Leuconostoc fallax TaxID=1251 RepID=UPI00208FFC91|nr:1-(5-phosphoribosyl)-5-[(5-phosphoribosylamino)methylideneamino]imidazole-4-carboxamide isomerase [Leuconostoc fallax]MCO6184484.1 1-(5-phosphoribosyl)-5-[(5-phosphoribosylamino)methylideneamino]imidazole-4-carboxamide isomerase [Leuconostoc fallax]